MANKKRKTSQIIEGKTIDVKKIISIALIAFLVVSITLSALFVIDSFAPANPKVYDRWVLSTFKGSYDGKNTPNSYYQLEIQKDYDSGELLYSCVDVEFRTWNGDDRPVKEIWINISDLYENEVKIFLGKGTANSTKLLKELTYSANDIKNDKDGWFRLYNNPSGLKYNVSGFYGELKIGFSANVKLREVVIVDVNNQLASTMSVTGCSVGKKPSIGINGNDISVTHIDKFEPIDMKNVCDEQDKFPFASAKDTSGGGEHNHVH